MIGQEYVRLSTFKFFRADRPIWVDVHPSVVEYMDQRERDALQKEIDTLAHYVRKAVAERPGTEYREYLELKAWEAMNQCVRWGSVEQD